MLLTYALEVRLNCEFRIRLLCLEIAKHHFKYRFLLNIRLSYRKLLHIVRDKVLYILDYACGRVLHDAGVHCWKEYLSLLVTRHHLRGSRRVSEDLLHIQASVELPQHSH